MNLVSSLLIDGAHGVTIGGTGASLKFFPPPAGTSSAKRGYVYCPGNNRANGQRLYVRAGGNIKSSLPATVGLYGVVGSCLPLLLGRVFTSGGSSTLPWMLSAEFVGDFVSGIVASIHETEFVANMTGVNFVDDEPFAIAVGVLFSASDVKNTASMYQFDILQ